MKLILSTCEQDLGAEDRVARAKQVLDEEIISRIYARFEHCKDIYHAITTNSTYHR